MTGLSYGLIGCGMMGLEHIKNVLLLDDVRISGVWDPVPSQAAQAAALAGCAALPTLDELIELEGLDAIIIASPNDRHLEQIEAIAAKRPLPLLVEKPLFTSLSDKNRIERIKRDYGRPIWVAMEYRYMPPIATFLEQAEKVTGGIKMLSIKEHRFPFLPKVDDWNRYNVRSGGTLVEKCCHFFDLMRLILASEPLRISATGGQAVNHKDESLSHGPSDIWDHAYVITDFKNGARAMLELCMFAEGSRYQEEITALGANGKIEVHVPGPSRFWPAKAGTPPIPKLIESPRCPKGPSIRDVPVDPALLAAGDHNGATFYQHQKFADVVGGKGKVEVGIEDGMYAVQMGLAAAESAETGKMIEF